MPEVPDPHVQLIIKGQDIRKRLQKLSSDQIAGMFLILPSESLYQRHVQRIDVNRRTESIGQDEITKLSGVI